MGALTLDDIDARIASLRTEIDTTGASLAALDGDITLKLLASAKLSGRTAAEWNAASPDLPLLWAYYGALKDKGGEIVALRGTKPRLRPEQLEELSRQLLGDSVAVPADPGQPGSRTLTGTPVHMISIARLQSMMATMFHDIASVVDRVCTAWTALPRLDTLDAKHADIALFQIIDEVGYSRVAEIQRRQVEHDRLTNEEAGRTRQCRIDLREPADDRNLRGKHEGDIRAAPHTDQLSRCLRCCAHDRSTQSWLLNVKEWV